MQRNGIGTNTPHRKEKAYNKKQAMQHKETKQKSATRSIQKNGEIKRIDVYQEFILWTAMPPTEKGKLGIDTQTEFCEKYKISHNTPTRWKSRTDFINQVTELRRQWAFEKTSEVIQGIYLSALKGNPFSQKLWLQYFLGFTEKTETTVTGKVEMSENDIRFIINGFPEPERTKYHGYITEIIDHAYALRNARIVEDNVWDDRRPEDEIQDEANTDALDVPAERTNAVAVRHSGRASSNMGDDSHRTARTSENNY